MATFLADLATNRATTPQALNKGNQQDGELRIFRAKYTAPASSPPAIADIISWGYLPKGAVIVGGYLNYAAGTASCTINIGDLQSAARYLAATSIASAGNTAVQPPVNATNGGASYEIATPAPGLSTDDSEIRSVVAGAAIAVNQVINLVLFYVNNN
jgi:hypothetical protein